MSNPGASSSVSLRPPSELPKNEIITVFAENPVLYQRQILTIAEIDFKDGVIRHLHALPVVKFPPELQHVRAKLESLEDSSFIP